MRRKVTRQLLRCSSNILFETEAVDAEREELPLVAKIKLEVQYHSSVEALLLLLLRNTATFIKHVRQSIAGDRAAAFTSSVCVLVSSRGNSPVG